MTIFVRNVLRAAATLSLTVNILAEDFIDLNNLMEIDDFLEDDDISNSPSITDPLEGLNRTIFRANDFVYRTVFTPFTRQYVRVVPREARKGVGNFFVNLEYPVRLAGSLLQFKFGRATKETGKFLVNSTIGLGGFMNAAKDSPILQSPEEDIGQAFGAWGVKHGIYIVLPLLGPSSLRDFAGRLGGNAADPLSEPWAQVEDHIDRLILQGTDTLNDLPEIIDLYTSITDAAIDPYVAVRDGYVQYRARQVRE